VDPRWIKTQGAGESDPIASNATEFGREQNRRVEVYEMRIESWNKL
jgi:outer membrane protein OmpA-like peptidoglycan-associated protein